MIVGRRTSSRLFGLMHLIDLVLDMALSVAGRFLSKLGGFFGSRLLVPSSLSDLSKNRDFLEYYVSRSPETIVELRSARYSF